jgi:hypothetical protein
MAVSHIKSNTVADWTGTVTVGNSTGGTQTIAATDLVRPGDWNSAHNQYYTLSGNTTGNSTASGTNVIFAASGAASIGGSTGSIIISAPVMSTFEPVPWNGVSTNLVAAGNATSSPVSVWPFVVNHPVSAGIMDLAFSCAFLTVGTSSGRQTMGVGVGLYQRGAGTNSTRLESITSQYIQYSVTGNNSSYSISQYTTTAYSGYGAAAQTNSGGSNISSQYTGLKKIGVPINSYLSPGQYYLAMMGTNSTSSINVGISLSYFGNIIATQASAFAPMGSLSSAYTAGSNPDGGRWREGYGSWTSAGSVTGLPASMNFTSISAANLSAQPHMRFWST